MIGIGSCGRASILFACVTAALCFLYADGLWQLVSGPGTVPVDEQFFNSAGVRIRYVSTGQGEPIILIHGWAADADMWDSLTEDLSRDYRVIALDCRGHGKTRQTD